MVVDSIQTVFHPQVNSTPGSVTQIREASMQFMRLSKTIGLPIFLVGHVTKGGGHCRTQNHGAYGGYGALL